jgi:hypothetical protein
MIRGRRHGASKAGAVDCFPKNPGAKGMCRRRHGAFGSRRRVSAPNSVARRRVAAGDASGEVHISLSPRPPNSDLLSSTIKLRAQHSSRHNSMCPRRARARHPPRGTPQPGNSSDHPRRRSLSRFQAQTFIAMAADRPARHRRPFLLARRSRSHTAARRHPGPPAALKGAGGRGGRGRGAAARGAPGVSAPRRAAAEKK